MIKRRQWRTLTLFNHEKKNNFLEHCESNFENIVVYDIYGIKLVVKKKINLDKIF